jgi:hypothetical protein
MTQFDPERSGPMKTWQAELRGLLDRVPEGAARLIQAFDEKRVCALTFGCETECGTVACIYGHVYGHPITARIAAEAARRTGVTGLTPLEEYIWPAEVGTSKNLADVRGEVVTWLAEHGSHVERAVASEPQRRT